MRSLPYVDRDDRDVEPPGYPCRVCNRPGRWSGRIGEPCATCVREIRDFFEHEHDGPRGMGRWAA